MKDIKISDLTEDAKPEPGQPEAVRGGADDDDIVFLRPEHNPLNDADGGQFYFQLERFPKIE